MSTIIRQTCLVMLAQTGLLHTSESTALLQDRTCVSSAESQDRAVLLLQTRSAPAYRLPAVQEPQNEQLDNGEKNAPPDSRRRKANNTQGCTPQCSWQCESVKCDEACQPVCKPPRCQTRCKGFDTSACRMECEEPNCAVVCPKRDCPGGNCPQCYTTCSKPVCRMRCAEHEQPCRNVCTHPECKWDCHAPKDCPRPKCEMHCEPPKDCTDPAFSISREFPPLEPGERETTSVAPSANASAEGATTTEESVLSSTTEVTEEAENPEDVSTTPPFQTTGTANPDFIEEPLQLPVE